MLCSDLLRCSLSLFILYNYVSYFVVKCDLALLLLRQGMCQVTLSHLLCIAFLKVTLDFSISALKFSSFVFSFWLTKGAVWRWTRRLLKLNLKSFSIIIIKLSSNKYLYFNTSIHHCLQLPYPNLTWLLSSFGV